MFRSSNSVIPTGTDHRGGDDLRSGEPALSKVEGDLVFVCLHRMGGDRVGVHVTETRTSGGKTLSSRRTAPTQAKAGLEWATGRLSPTIAELTQAVEQEAQQCPEAQRLQTHPGVGALTALAFVLIIGRAERFQCGKQIASYLGLVPLEESS